MMFSSSMAAPEYEGATEARATRSVRRLPCFPLVFPSARQEGKWRITWLLAGPVLAAPVADGRVLSFRLPLTAVLLGERIPLSARPHPYPSPFPYLPFFPGALLARVARVSTAVRASTVREEEEEGVVDDDYTNYGDQ